MAVVALINMALNLLKGRPGLEPVVKIDQGWSMAEGTAYQFELASGGGAYTLPFVGAGQGDVATLGMFAVVVDQTVTLSWAGGSVSLVGTPAQPAFLIAGHCSSASVPTLTNASGSTCNVVVAVAGASA